jgi:hypothetical protein
MKACHRAKRLSTKAELQILMTVLDKQTFIPTLLASQCVAHLFASILYPCIVPVVEKEEDEIAAFQSRHLTEITWLPEVLQNVSLP